MRRALWGGLFALALAGRAEAQAADASALPPLTGLDGGGLDASVADASAADGGARDGGARDAGDSGAARDAGPLDLDLPEQGCHLAHAGELGGALPLLLALALMRRRRA